jgi:NADPH-dependent 2,4-dienoyl-CoA reductase/sulfur reductase-like enzyme
MGNERILILGNGGAAMLAAKSARLSGHQGEIRLVSDQNGPVFNPMLSPYYLKGIIPWDQCFPFGREFYREYGITCCIGSPVQSLDTGNRRTILANGKVLGYDRCLIATGASPALPPVPGLKDSPRCFPLRTAASVRSLEEAILSAKKVVVLGASLVGLKVAEILRKRKVHVVLVDVVEQVLPRGAHPSSASILKTYFEEHNVDFHLGCATQGMEDERDGTVCRLPGDIVEKADFVAVCTGVRPNLDFVNRDEVKIDQAVLVDERMRTSVQNLYAAGDASQGINLVSGKHELLGTWGNACCQGRTAGYNMAGRDVIYPGSLPQNISPFFEWTYAQLGDLRLHGENGRCITFGDPRQGGYVVLTFEQDILTGANLINCVYLAGKLRRAIIQKWHWSRYLRRISEILAVSSFEKVLDEMTGKAWRLPGFIREHEGPESSFLYGKTLR